MGCFFCTSSGIIRVSFSLLELLRITALFDLASVNDNEVIWSLNPLKMNFFGKTTMLKFSWFL